LLKGYGHFVHTFLCLNGGGSKAMNNEELRETRKQMFAQMEQRLQEIHPKDGDRLFYYHSSEDRIVLSHALFWVMTQPQCLKGKIRKERFFLLLRQYEEEMLDAFLTEDEYFSELLRYCNILFEMLPMILMSTGFRTDKQGQGGQVSVSRRREGTSRAA